MVKRGKAACCPTAGIETSCCRVDAVISVDERGQTILPKEVRSKAGIRAGDKLAVVSWQQGDRVCCIALIKVEELAGMVRSFLGPVMKGLSDK